MADSVKSVRALARGLEVFKALQQQPAASLQDLHRDTGLSKPTLLRILKTLEEGGMARRSLGDGRYRVSANVRFFGRDLGEHDAIAEQAAPELDRLCRELLWPSDIAVYKDGAMEILETSRPQTPFLVNRGRMGYRVHMLMSAVGCAYLAFCPAGEREEILARLRHSDDPYDRKARNRAAVAAELAECRRRGADGSASLLRVQTSTGRKHQVRRHLQSIGCPIFLDPLEPAFAQTRRGKKRAAAKVWARWDER